MEKLIQKAKGGKLSSKLFRYSVISLSLYIAAIVIDAVSGRAFEPSGALIWLALFFATMSDLAEEIESLKKDK